MNYPKNYPKDYNSKRHITEWVEACLKTFKGEEVERQALLRIGLKAANKGLWRGDISTLWMERGHTTADIEDLYP